LPSRSDITIPPEVLVPRRISRKYDSDGAFDAFCARCGSDFKDTEPPQEGRKRYCPDCWSAKRVVRCFFCPKTVVVFFTPTKEEQIILCQEHRPYLQKEREIRILVRTVNSGGGRAITCEACGEEKTVSPHWNIDFSRPLLCPSCYTSLKDKTLENALLDVASMEDFDG